LALPRSIFLTFSFLKLAILYYYFINYPPPIQDCQVIFLEIFRKFKNFYETFSKKALENLDIAFGDSKTRAEKRFNPKCRFSRINWEVILFYFLLILHILSSFLCSYETSAMNYSRE